MKKLFIIILLLSHYETSLFTMQHKSKVLTTLIIGQCLGNNPLHKTHEAILIRNLLEETHGNINTRGKGHLTPLGIALFYYNIDLAELLIKNGADPYEINTIGADGNNLLFQAIKNKRQDFGVFLIKNGIDIDVKVKNSNGDTCTLAHMAASYCCNLIIKALLNKYQERGTSINNIVDSKGQRLLDYAHNSYDKTLNKQLAQMLILTALSKDSTQK